MQSRIDTRRNARVQRSTSPLFTETAAQFISSAHMSKNKKSKEKFTLLLFHVYAFCSGCVVHSENSMKISCEFACFTSL